MRQATQILINATFVNTQTALLDYEFLLNLDLKLIKAISLSTPENPSIDYQYNNDNVFYITNPQRELKGMLFELNNVRVNPYEDNTLIIHRLVMALKAIGIQIDDLPEPNSMAICYKPLGVISNIVRFYFQHDGQAVFLAPAVHSKLRIV